LAEQIKIAEKALKELLIIFIKNPELGKVKTRLAASIGDSSALRIYKELLNKTFEVTTNLKMKKWIFYSDSIESEDQWNEGYTKKLQKGNDLGERMLNAFDEAFKADFQCVCIIGSDCFELTSDIVLDAFFKLRKNSFVIGPARDGGYYLLGMNEYERIVFQNKKWSTDEVAIETIKDFELLKKPYHALLALSDIDTIEDLVAFPELKTLAGNNDSHTD